MMSLVPRFMEIGYGRSCTLLHAAAKPMRNSFLSGIRSLRCNHQRLIFTVLIASSLLGAFPESASGQGVSEEVAGQDVVLSEDGAKTTYFAAFFEQFNPLTLQNMIRRIPGVSIADSAADEERRGLRGSQDAILINGQQIVGKNNGGSSALTQILASQVEYIEIIRGSSSEVQSTTQEIINVVLTEDAKSVMQVQASLLFYDGDDSVRLNPTLIYSSSSAQNNYTVFLRSLQNARPWTRDKVTTDLDGQLVQDSNENEQLATHKMRATGRFEQNTEAGSRLQLSSYMEGELVNRERREVIDVPGVLDSPPMRSDILEADKRDIWTAELSADYSRPLTQGASITFLGFFNWEEESRDREVLDLFGPEDVVTTRQARKDTKTESVLRTTYDWTLGQALGAQVGAEGALNTQQTDFELLTRVGGELVPLPIFNSSGKVTEYRGEVFSTVRWRQTETLNTEFGLAVEASRISQSGIDVESSRFLSYLKPSFNAFWNATPSDRVFFSMIRDVQQLDFLEFVATITDRDQELEAGNPDLRPEKSWDASLGYERGLKNGAGLISLSGFYRFVEDVSGRTLFQNSISQPGNVGSGSEIGGELELALQFTRLGWWDGTLTTKYLLRDTSVTDPFSGLDRNFDQTPNWEFEVSYRHDVDKLINGYIDLTYSEDGRKQIYDLDYIEDIKDSGTLSVVVAHQFRENMELRATARNLLNKGRITRERVLFAPTGSGGRTQIGNRFEKHEWGNFFSLVLNWNV